MCASERQARRILANNRQIACILGAYGVVSEEMNRRAGHYWTYEMI